MTPAATLAAVLLKRLRCKACGGVLQVDGSSPEFALALHKLADPPLICFLCGRSPDDEARPQAERPPAPPLTGNCGRGHERARWGYHGPDPRTLSGFSRRCTKCEEENAVVTAGRDPLTKSWNGRLALPVARGGEGG